MTEQEPERPGVVETADDGDRPSITEVNGTVARFEMAYNPQRGDRFVFGPPLWQRLPSLVYLGFALAVAATVFAAYHGASNTRLYEWIVEGDQNRPIGSGPLAFLIVLSAVATVIRAGLRGVIVTADGVEVRTLLALGMPRVRRFGWAQIDRIVIDDADVMLELWNGTYEHLPRVKDGTGLADLLARIAASHGRDVTRLTNGR